MKYTRRLRSVVLTGVKNQCALANLGRHWGLSKHKRQSAGEKQRTAVTKVRWQGPALYDSAFPSEDNNAVNWV